jgi:dihydroxycyclohexadiene carboxylate dehydrogenase
MTTESAPGKALDPLARGARRFEDKVVVVAGAGQGIGLTVVRRLATEGATVVIGDWAEDIAQKAKAEVESIGEKASVHNGDYRSWEGCESLMKHAIDTHGRIDSLIVIVGGTVWSAPYQHNTPEQIVETVNKNFWPTMWCCRAVLPYMIEQHRKSDDGVGGNIVTLATHALVGLNRVPYAASKGGLIGLTTALSKESGRYGIRVNCVAPSANSGKEQTYRRDYRIEHVARSVVPEEDRISQPSDEEGNREERPLHLA